jgi:FtsZ-interacting cell division protein ZipA
MIIGVVALAIVGGTATTIVRYQNSERNKETQVTAEKNIKKNREREENAISGKSDEVLATTAATTVAESTSKPDETKQTDNANTTATNISSTNAQQPQQATNQETQKQDQKAVQQPTQQKQHPQQKPASQPVQQKSAAQLTQQAPAPQPEKPSRPSGVDRATSDRISAKLVKDNWTDGVQAGYDSKVEDLIQSAINLYQGVAVVDSIKQPWDISDAESDKGLHYVDHGINKVWMGDNAAN